MTLQSADILPSERILAEAKEHIFELFKKQANTRLVYHNYELTHQFLAIIEAIAKETKASEAAKELTFLAGIFSFTGYLTNYARATETSMQEAEQFLAARNYSKAKTEKIKDLIRLLANQKTPVTPEQELFNDAYNALKYGETYAAKTPLLLLEQELMQHRNMSKEQWTSLQLQELLGVKFYTSFGKQRFESLIANNILSVKKQVDKYQRKGSIIIEEPKTLGIFEELEGAVPNRAIQTYLRTNYRNHINLSAIADNKANIMISVNAILLSVLISLLSYKNMAETNPMVLMAFFIFFTTGLTSLIFAVLSARPKVTMVNKNITDIHELKKNMVFFGSYVHLDLAQYEQAVDAMFRDGALIYGNMARDIYFLGKVLDKKYRYLTNSYNIFMVGFAATAITLAIALVVG